MASAADTNSRRSWMAGFNSLSILRQLGLMIGLAASIAIGFAVVLWSQKPDYQVLFSNLNYSDINEVVEQLNLYDIPYELDTSGHAILVPKENVHKARLKLAAEGFSSDKTVGLEILDQDQGLGTSQFIESARYRRGLEGELARTISSLVAVRSARVHLAIPKQSMFIRDPRKPRASVFVELFSGRKLERTQVAAIANLVASSVPELDVKDVTVVDQRGRLLNSRDIADGEVVEAAKQLEYSSRIEDTLRNRVRSILQPVVGLGNFRTEVSVDVDFTHSEQTNEQYNPDLPALRSEKTLEEKRASNAPEGVPGALSNQPPGPNAVPEQINNQNNQNGEGEQTTQTNSSGMSKEQTVRNYELDRTLSYTKSQQGQIKRLTVAVVVNDFVEPGEDGAQTRTQWSQNELDRLKLLVQNAVGYSAVRGDSVTVINSPFIPEAPEVDDETPFWEQEWFFTLLKQVGAALFVLVLILGVLRPIMKSLARSGSAKDGSPDLGPAGEVSAELQGLDAGGLAEDKVTFSGVDSAMMSTPNESYEYQLNAIRSMVAEDPAKVAQAVKQWVTESE